MGKMLTMANSKYQLGLYEKSMPSTLTWEEKLMSAKKAGFDSLEISIDETDAKLERLNYSEAQFSEIQNAVNKVGLPIQSLCLSAHRKYPLGATDANVRKQSLEIMEKALIFANRLGIRMIQLAGYDVYYEESSTETQKYFEENLNKAAQLASKYGVIMGFETMETEFLNTCTKAMKYVNSINSPYLGVYPDVGNLTNACRIYNVSIEKDIHEAKGHIFAAHLKEIVEGKYREIPFGTGDTQYDPALQELKAQAVNRFTAEFWYIGSQTWEEDLAFANQYLRNKIDRFYK